jgi:hypothetical protein
MPFRRRKEERLATAKLKCSILHTALIEDCYSSEQAFADAVVLMLLRHKSILASFRGACAARETGIHAFSGGGMG